MALHPSPSPSFFGPHMIHHFSIINPFFPFLSFSFSCTTPFAFILAASLLLLLLLLLWGGLPLYPTSSSQGDL